LAQQQKEKVDYFLLWLSSLASWENVTGVGLFCVLWSVAVVHSFRLKGEIQMHSQFGGNNFLVIATQKI